MYVRRAWRFIVTIKAKNLALGLVCCGKHIPSFCDAADAKKVNPKAWVYLFFHSWRYERNAGRWMFNNVQPGPSHEEELDTAFVWEGFPLFSSQEKNHLELCTDHWAWIKNEIKFRWGNSLLVGNCLLLRSHCSSIIRSISPGRNSLASLGSSRIYRQRTNCQ